MQEIDGIVGVVDKEARKFRPRAASPAATALVLAGVVAGASCVAWNAFDRLADVPALYSEIAGQALNALPALSVIVESAPLLSLACVIIGTVMAITERLRRCPPPAYRVKDELTMYLLEKSMLPDDKTEWGGRLKVGRLRFDRRSSLATLWFDVRSDKATEEAFRNVSKGSAFAHAQSVEIKEHRDKNGRRHGFDLLIFYRVDDDVFARVLRKVKP